MRERKTYLWLSEEQRTTADDKSIEQGVDFMKDIKKTYLLHRTLYFLYGASRQKIWAG